MNNDFEIISPPSETILRRVSDLNIDLRLFRESLGLDKSTFARLIHDQLEVDDRLAYKLSELLGGSEVFWTNRYINYSTELCVSNKQVYEQYKSTLDELCEVRQTDLSDLLNDFQYSSLEHLILDYFESPIILYSRTQRFEPSPIKLANWIRECEKEAENLIYSGDVNRFSSDVLHNAIAELVSYSKVNRLENVLSRIQRVCFDCGVVLLCKPSESGYGISGLTKVILKNYRLVIVTDRYKNNAAFWFTLLHELAHCILHNLRFPLVHYSDDQFHLASLKTNNIFEEDEANQFVESVLFSEEVKSEIKNCHNYKNLIRIAVKYDISASLIAAQIHREKIAPYSWYRKVYRKVVFKE